MWRQVPEQGLEGTPWERNKKVKYKEFLKKKKQLKLSNLKKVFLLWNCPQLSVYLYLSII